MRYVDIASSSRFSKLRALDSKRVESIRTDFVGIPSDYLDFIAEVGAGEIGDASFMLYTGPVPPSGILPKDLVVELGDTMLFGDDFQGTNYGFDPSQNWAVVVVDSSTGEHWKLFDRFEEFVRARLHY